MNNDLRSALSKLATWGVTPCCIDTLLSPRYEIAEHYFNFHATVPGSSRSGNESMCLYEQTGKPFKVLAGFFGNRIINERLLAEYCRADHFQYINSMTKVEPVINIHAPCHAHKMQEGLSGLPILTLTRQDAGAFITSGVICAKNERTGSFISSIHRLKVIDDCHLSLAMRPTGSLFRCYQESLRKNRALPISINIGIPPIYYLLTSISSDFLEGEECKLKKIGGITGYPIALAKGKSSPTYCFADSELVIEGEITTQTCDECTSPDGKYAMPEFLGYMGEGKTMTPIIRVTGIYHKENPIFQTFLGPGKEQSELLAIPTELFIKSIISEEFSEYFTLLDAHYPSFGGGQLTLILRVIKIEDILPLTKIQEVISSSHPLCKNVYIVDDDVDIYSPEDVFWALTTRFQPSRDLYHTRVRGMSMDPSQSVGYLKTALSVSDFSIFDLTKPILESYNFLRFNNFTMR